MTGSFALPIGDPNGELKGSVWAGRARVRGPRWAQLPLLTIGMLGLQIVWSVEMAYGMFRALVVYQAKVTHKPQHRHTYSRLG